MNSNLFSDDEIKEIMDKDLLELMGAQNMPQEKKEELYAKMAKTIQDRVIARIDDKLDENSREEFIRLVDEGDPPDGEAGKAEIEEFLRSKNLDSAKLLVEEAIIYKMEIMNLYKRAKQTTEEK